MLPIIGLLVATTTIIVGVLFVPYLTKSEQRLWEQYGLRRTHWLPPLMLGLSMVAGWITPVRFVDVIVDKYGIIVFILTLALLAEGMRESGFFQFLAYKIVRAARGITPLMVLGLFVLCSAATYVTTNDVVVLVFTPLFLTISYQTGLRYTIPLMLMEFVAANTISAGLYIGTPTNIIVSEEIGLSFMDYFYLMLEPTILLFVVTFALAVLYTFYQIGAGNWTWSYTIPDPNRTFSYFDMANWCLTFAGLVGGVALTTDFEYSLAWPSLPVFGLALLYYALRSYETSEEGAFEERYPSPIRPLTVLPYEIATFGLSLFVLVDGLIAQELLREAIVGFLVSNLSLTPGAGLASVFVTGVGVNLFNDLPAATFVAEVLRLLPADAVWYPYIVQMVMVGLNIGCYLTPLGALAGLLWFHTMRTHRNRLQGSDSPTPLKDDRLIVPRYRHLIIGGTVTFCVVAPLTAFLIFIV